MENRFEKKFIPEPNSGCWLWIAACDRLGYGEYRQKGKMRRAHRISYEANIGPIPDNYELDHLCGVRSCVNPLHLEPVYHKENLLRGNSFSAKCARQTHCVNGHEFNERNTYRWNNRRMCRECCRIYASLKRRSK